MAEGPSLLKVANEWRLYFDRFDMRFNRFGLAVSKDLHHWIDRTDEVNIPRVQDTEPFSVHQDQRSVFWQNNDMNFTASRYAGFYQT